MNERTFLQRFQHSSERDNLVHAVEAELWRFATDEGITSGEMSDEELRELAEGVVERGVSVDD